MTRCALALALVASACSFDLDALRGDGIDAGAPDSLVDAAQSDTLDAPDFDAGPPRDAGATDTSSVDAGPLDAPTTTDATPTDALTTDAGDPCVGVSCTGSTPYCIGGTCVACESSADCGGLRPICDLARGACVAVATNPICAPCSNDFDCLGMGTCTTLDGGTFRERVCLPPSSGCPSGMTTSGAPSGLCVPALGATCRNFVTARQRAACTAAADCAPLGATAGIDYEPDICPAAVCLFPCGVAGDCPAGLTLCDATFHCRP